MHILAEQIQLNMPAGWNQEERKQSSRGRSQPTAVSAVPKHVWVWNKTDRSTLTLLKWSQTKTTVNSVDKIQKNHLWIKKEWAVPTRAALRAQEHFWVWRTVSATSTLSRATCFLCNNKTVVTLVIKALLCCAFCYQVSQKLMKV